MKKLVIFLAIALSFATIRLNAATPKNPDNNPKIQVALLLDTSGSMDGLLEQAKSQLWKIVNELATAKQNGQTPNLEIALYEYGKSSIPAADGYIRNLVPLTTDLDLVSEELFKLQTNGGDEYCGLVIDKAHHELKWSNTPTDLKMVFIAGNEPFTQGPKDYKDACKAAIKDGIIINTIFCGDEAEGRRTSWKNGADLADGSYTNIDHNQQTVFIDAPQDAEIQRLNGELNKTYIAYGAHGADRKKRQEAQDANAEGFGSANSVQRAVSKSNAFYSNSSWDLVDAVEDEEVDISEISEEEMPAEMKEMNEEERVEYVEAKAKERKEIQDKINELNEEREKYVAKKRKEMALDSETLDEAVIPALKQKAEALDFEFE